MSPMNMLTWLSGAIVVSVAGMVLGGMVGKMWLVLMAAGLFMAVAVAASVATNAPLWRLGRVVLDGRDEAIIALRRNAKLIAWAYGWGALAMQALYTTPLTGLKWQHGWQYALIMLLLALGANQFARGLEDPKQQHGLVALGAPLAIANALLAAGGLVFLTASGKLMAQRADWAANQVFLFGALTVMLLSAIAVKTHARLTRG